MSPAEPRFPGCLIALEGIDGAGKTTQVGLLADLLRAIGEDVVTSKEPTRGPWGMKIRESAREGRLPLPDELDAFMRDRREHVAGLISPALERGAIVILDRYFYSTIAYQGSRGANWQAIREQMREFPTPNMVVVLDVEPQLGLSRVAARDGTPNHFEEVDQLTKALAIFRQLNGNITQHVSGSQPIEVVRRDILKLFVAEHGPYQKARCAKAYGCDEPSLCGYAKTGECAWWNRRRRLYDVLEGRPPRA